MAETDISMSERDVPIVSAKEYGLPDEEIVAEIPIYLTHRIAKNLHLLQYPQRTSSVKTGVLNPSVARLKPIHGQIEMDIQLDVTSPMYSKERGRELGVGLSDNGRILDIQTLVSVNIPKSSNYMAGVFREGALHMTPIEKITQLQPSLKYLDRVAEKELAASKLDNDDDDDEDGKKEIKAQTIQVTVRSAQAEEALRQQQSSIAYIQQKLEEEPWSKLSYYDVGSEESSLVSSRLLARHTDDLACKTTPDEFLTAIIGSIEPDVL
ncbi:hypothetical protein GGI19_006573 [Coemansia pectinata]|uniref:DNA-directed RNA polymerase III subunit RPC5 n=1 Tax=Coemansia pectinata TaxID=1052879 RepID=A0A9W8L7F4_9FUNG|nr:hypothetical protein GGI19_006573 [Coemansia pectinata]